MTFIDISKLSRLIDDDRSCIIAHPINTILSFLALVIAATTIPFVKRRIHAIPLATNLSVLAFVSAHTTVQSVTLHIHTLLLAAIRSLAALQ